jgi:hypothetical protein
MSNSISLASKFVAFIDQVYRAESKTALLDPVTQAPDFLAANEVKVMKLSTVGLGNYSRTEGYPAGDITATWETLQQAAEEQKQRAQRERLSGRAWAVLLVLITQAVGLVVLFIRTGSIR